MKATFNQHIGIFEEAVPKEWCKEFLLSLPPNIPSILTTYAGLPYLERCLLIEPPSQREYIKNLIFNQLLPHYLNSHPLFYSFLNSNDPLDILDYKFQTFKLTEGSPTWYSANNPSSFPYSSRTFTYIIYLNDVKEGGETEFLYQKLRIPPKLGTVCIFPSYFTHSYRDNPPLSNPKNTITGWLIPSTLTNE